MKRIIVKLGLIAVVGLGSAVMLLGLLNQRVLVARATGPILYVAPDGSDTTDCTSSANPCATIQYAVDQADAGAEIRAAMGTYAGVSAREGVTQVAYMSKTVALRGGYTTTNWIEPYPITQPTTLDAQGQGRVLHISGGGITVTLANLHVTGGHANGTSYQGHGGGIYIAGASTWITNSAVTSNTATGFGGGISALSASLRLTGSTVAFNLAGVGGGGIGLNYGTAIVDGSIVVSNTVPGPGTSAVGGGIAMARGEIVLNRNLIVSNTAGYGGGMASYFATSVILSDNLIVSNSADSGGGLGLHYSSVTLDRNTVQSNTARVEGGGLVLDTSPALLSGNRILANVARSCGGVCAGGSITVTLKDTAVLSNVATEYWAGGIGLFASHAILINTIVADNSSPQGSALRIEASSVQLIHATIARNRNSPGLIVTGTVNQPSTVVLTNTILASHTIGVMVSAGSTAKLDATLWGSGVWSNGLDWGGEGTIITGTVNVWGNPAFIDPDAGDYHIGPGSAAIDAGVNAGVNVDIDGEPRPDGFGYDIGADEYMPRSRLYLPIVIRS